MPGCPIDITTVHRVNVYNAYASQHPVCLLYNPPSSRDVLSDSHHYPDTMSTTQNFGSAAMAAAMEIPAPPAQDPPMQQYRGAALNQPFDMRARMKASREKPMVGFWYGAFPDVGVARMVGQAGYDFVMIDWEHTPYS